MCESAARYISITMTFQSGIIHYTLPVAAQKWGTYAGKKETI